MARAPVANDPIPELGTSTSGMGAPHRPIDPIREWGVAIREWLYSCMDYNICLACPVEEQHHEAFVAIPVFDGLAPRSGTCLITVSSHASLLSPGR